MTGWAVVATAFSFIYCVTMINASAPLKAQACYMEDAQGQVSLVRRGKTGPPLVSYLPLQEGDNLVIQGAASRITILCGWKRIEITKKQSPYLVPARASAPTQRDNFLAWLSEFFSHWTKREEELQILAVRGSERLSIPLLAGPDSEIAAGRRTLCVGWLGGESPFSV